MFNLWDLSGWLAGVYNNIRTALISNMGAANLLANLRL